MMDDLLKGCGDTFGAANCNALAVLYRLALDAATADGGKRQCVSTRRMGGAGHARPIMLATACQFFGGTPDAWGTAPACTADMIVVVFTTSTIIFN